MPRPACLPKLPAVCSLATWEGMPVVAWAEMATAATAATMVAT